MSQTKQKDKDTSESSDGPGFTVNSSRCSSFDHAGPDKEYAIAEKETKQVFMQRLLVIAVLLVAAVSVCIVVFFITTKAEEHEFEAHFEGGAEKIVFSFEQIVQEKLGAVGSLCLALTAAGKIGTHDDINSSGDTWPFVTMDSFQERAASARILSNVLHMSVLPMVTEANQEAWEEYSVKNSAWYAEGFAYQQALLENGFHLDGPQKRALKESFKNKKLPSSIDRDTRELQDTEANATDEEEFDLFIPYIYEYTEYWDIVPPNPDDTPFAPVWQSAPVTALDGINLNVRSFPHGRTGFDIATSTGELALRGFMTAEPSNTTGSDFTGAWYAELLSTKAGKPVYYSGDPLSEAAYPIFSDFDGERRVVGTMNAQFSWQTYFEDLLPDNARGFVMVLENACDGSYTYQINGAAVEMVGMGDLHDPKFSGKKMSTYLRDGLTIHDGSTNGVKLNQRGCPYSLHVYPSQEMHDAYHTNMPVLVTVCILFIFLFTAGTFFFYDRLVEKRQQVVFTTAKQSTDIIGSLFPETVRDRLMQADQAGFLSPSQRVKSYLSGGTEELGEVKPIADLFPHTTVMFADIAGFTAWSSTRDPSQVFILLQTVYGEFDEIARRRNVFKVETIGDSYVAVAGLPNPQPDHAVKMCRFAWECKAKLGVILKELELSLGPDTNDLGMRFGLHSGAVTAGVLRGDRARFQLFGDTVNTAARMESTGVRGKIQVSHATAHILDAVGKGHWLDSREDAVIAKGKGVLNTFFVNPSRAENGEHRRASFDGSSRISDLDMKAMKEARLVQWMTDLLLGGLRQIVVRRKTLQGGNFTVPTRESTVSCGSANIPLDEVVEYIKLPDFDDNAVSYDDPSSVEIPEQVVNLLRDHVAAIAATYRDNPFHNFEHACHVTQAATKFLGRIVSPEIDLQAFKGKKDARGAVASHLHDYTHGINSDPLTLFGIVYSALIHDCDHYGVGNAQTIKENDEIGAKYKGKSVAEQNSFDTAWNLLMSDDLVDLRAYLFGDDASELKRFRQVVVNIVLATDIFDKELNGLRKQRWTKAFEESSDGTNESLRATIVLEHIIQASDVSHTMQHWHIYRKWNRLLFIEMYNAFKAGRMGVDPTTFWYKGEIGFLDNYVIPLAKKLKDCGVFGVSSDECLTYALQNRAEWEVRGEAILEELIEEVEGKKDVNNTSIDYDV